MTKLTQEQAIEHYTELMHRVRVGAFGELDVFGEPPDDDNTLVSITNLERWASRQALEFVWSHDMNAWFLSPIEQGHDEVGGYES